MVVDCGWVFSVNHSTIEGHNHSNIIDQVSAKVQKLALQLKSSTSVTVLKLICKGES